MPAGLLRPGPRHLCPVRLGYGHRGNSVQLCVFPGHLGVGQAAGQQPVRRGAQRRGVHPAPVRFAQFWLRTHSFPASFRRIGGHLRGVRLRRGGPVFLCERPFDDRLCPGQQFVRGPGWRQYGERRVLFGGDAPRHPGGSRSRAAVCGQRRLPGTVEGNPSRGHSAPVPGGGKLPGSHRRPPLPLGRREPVPRGERSLSQRPALRRGPGGAAGLRQRRHGAVGVPLWGGPGPSPAPG